MTWGGLWGDAMRDNVDTAYQRWPPASRCSGSQRQPGRAHHQAEGEPAQPDQWTCSSLPMALVPLAMKQGVAEKLNRTSPRMPQPAQHDPGVLERLLVPQIFSITGSSTTPLVKNPPTAWADLWRPEFKGRIVLPEISHSDRPRYIIPIGALAQGKSPKDEAAGLRDAEEDGGPASDLGQGHRYDDERDAHRGRGHRHPLQVADLYASRAGTRRSSGCTRREGGIAYSSGTCIAKNTEEPEAAEEYLNVTMDPERAAFAAKISQLRRHQQGHAGAPFATSCRSE